MLNIAGMEHRLPDIINVLGISQVELSKKTGIGTSSISEIMHRKKPLREVHIQSLSKALGIPAWQIFVDPKAIPSEDDLELLSRYSALSEKKQKEVLNFISFKEQEE